LRVALLWELRKDRSEATALDAASSRQGLARAAGERHMAHHKSVQDQRLAACLSLWLCGSALGAGCKASDDTNVDEHPASGAGTGAMTAGSGAQPGGAPPVANID